MNGYVVDASVAVKWLVSEDFSAEAATLLDGRATLIAPDLLFAEATNAESARDQENRARAEAMDHYFSPLNGLVTAAGRLEAIHDANTMNSLSH
jgi:predicted nucleic acid-binding protein